MAYPAAHANLMRLKVDSLLTLAGRMQLRLLKHVVALHQVCSAALFEL